ncbi:hypothetical protein GF336_00015 [Candidatus Woesearchaeota archaeon]|nr:hypothetical protein [Candidatus Woesearchaeota archaeon]
MARRARTKIKKKMWVPINAPGIFNNQTIGETNVYAPQDAEGKILPANLMNLTGDARKQNTIGKFVVDNVRDGKAFTTMTGYKMVPSSVKRMVRRGRDKADISFEARSGDGKKFKVKVIIVTKGFAQNSVLTKLRKDSEQIIKKKLKSMNSEKFFEYIVNHKLQSELKKVLSKIYPLKTYEVKEASIVKERHEKLKEKAEKTEAPEEEGEAPAEEQPAEKVKPEEKSTDKKEKKASEEKEAPKAETEEPKESSE